MEDLTFWLLANVPKPTENVQGDLVKRVQRNNVSSATKSLNSPLIWKAFCAFPYSSSSILWCSLLSLKLSYFSHLCHLSTVQFLVALLDHLFHSELGQSFLSWKSQQWTEKFCLQKCCVSRGWAYYWNHGSHERIYEKDESKSLSTPHTKNGPFLYQLWRLIYILNIQTVQKMKPWEILRKFLEAIFDQESVIWKKK